MHPHEFVCADCKTDVCSWGGDADQTVCAGCDFIRSIREEMTIEQEKRLRERLGCELPAVQ